ncbi:MAG: hypothetical protein IPI49_01650 [Myxococcales bacterium]|nr:hypothetical protein [Myxococcales bacterium]
MLLDGRYRVLTPIAEGVLLRELQGRDEHTGADVAVWLPHRAVTPAFEDIQAELGLELPGCRRVLDLGRESAYIIGEPADHAGPRPRRTPHVRAVIAGWFRAVAGIIDRNHRAGRWHGVLTCDDVAISGGKLVVAGFGFWVRADPEAISEAICAPGAESVRRFCAPEVAHSAIGPAADLWALGRCTLALATSSTTRQGLGELAARHAPLAELLSGLLEPDPDQRRGDLRELAEQVTQALEEPFSDEPGAASRRAVTSPLRPTPRRAPVDGASEMVTSVRTESLQLEDLIEDPVEDPVEDQVPDLNPDSEFRDGNTTLAEPPKKRQASAPPRGVVVEEERTFDEIVDTSADNSMDTATYEPGTGIWTGTSLTAIDDGPGVVVPTPWSPARAPIQVISMKDPSGPTRAPRTAPRQAPLVPRIRAVELPRQPRPSPAALGRIAPPRARSQPAGAPRRWPMTVLVIAVAIAALLFAAALLWS